MILLKLIMYVITGIGLFYPAYLVNTETKNIKLSLITLIVSIGIMFGASYKMMFIIGLLSTAVLCYRVFILNKPFKKDKPVFIPEHERSNEKLYLESDLGTIEVSNPYRSILVSGGAGSGKSKSVFYPFITQFMKNEYSGILYDFKSPELTEFAYSEYKKNNSKVDFKVLDFKNPTKSNKVNPLSPRYITKQAIAVEMATVLINNLLPESIKKKDFFTRSSISILAGCIWFLAKNTPQFSTLPHLIAMVLDYPSSKLIEVICTDKECAGMLSSIREAHEMKAEKQIAAVVGTLKMALGQVNIAEIFELMSEDEVNLDINNPNNPTFLCIGNDSTLSSTYAPVISLVISCCLRLMNQPNKRKSCVLLDELPTIFVPGLEQLPATARSNKVITMLGFQDLSQLIDSYGNDKSQVLLSNCGSQFYGRSTNEKTADMLTRLAGKHDVLYTSKSEGTNYGDSSSSSSEGTSQSYQQRERITSTDILQLKPGAFISMIADNDILPFFKTVRFSELQDISYETLPEIARVDSSKTFDRINKEAEQISLKPKEEDLLLDIDINDFEQINPDQIDLNDNDLQEDDSDNMNFNF